MRKNQKIQVSKVVTLSIIKGLNILFDKDDEDDDDSDFWNQDNTTCGC